MPVKYVARQGKEPRVLIQVIVLDPFYSLVDRFIESPTYMRIKESSAC